MLSHENIGLHNVVELEPASHGGLYLRRFPAEIRAVLSPLGRMVSLESAGCELRFVTDSHNFRLDLDCQPHMLATFEHHECDVWVFRGAFFHSKYRLTSGRVNSINIVNLAGSHKTDEVTPEAAHAAGFSPQVWRVCFGRYPAILHGVDFYGGEARPPHADEVPSRTWGAYGSSITSGSGALSHPSSYIYQAARQLGWDVCNQGLSGSCRCEPEVAKYLASRSDWDLATLEIGVNVRGGFSPEEFAERARFLLEQMAAAARRVALITIYPNSASLGVARDPSGIVTVHEKAYNGILRELAPQYDNVTLVEGHDILDNFAGLTNDLIHPSDYGHARMGHNLAGHLQALS